MDNGIDRIRHRDPSPDVSDSASVRDGAKPPTDTARTPEIAAPADMSAAAHLSKAVQAAATELRLDAFLDATRPVVHTPEGDVRVAAPYREAASERAPSIERAVARNTPELRAIAARIGISESDLRHIQRGGGDPELVQRLTQALVDAGRLPASVREAHPPFESRDLETRVRVMMSDYGIGYDEAGYVRQALAHIAPTKSSLVRVSLATVRPGDVFARAPGIPVGILRRVRELSPAEESERRQESGFETGRIVAYEVDASHPFTDVDGGGVSREVWWHDEETGRWARSSTACGVEAPFDAVYRPAAPGAHE